MKKRIGRFILCGLLVCSLAFVPALRQNFTEVAQADTNYRVEYTEGQESYYSKVLSKANGFDRRNAVKIDMPETQDYTYTAQDEGNDTVEITESANADFNSWYSTNHPAQTNWSSQDYGTTASAHSQATGLAFLESVAARNEHGLTLQAIYNRLASNPTVSPYMNSKFYSVVNDALSIENINRSLDLIQQANYYRSTPLRVSAEEMMIAAVSNGIFQASHNPHNLFYSDSRLYGDTCDINHVCIGENLAEGYYDPFEGWYDYEGSLYAAGDRSANVGHYTTLLNEDYSITGFATAYDDVENLTSPYAHCQVFGNTTRLGSFMTVEEFRAALNW